MKLPLIERRFVQATLEGFAPETSKGASSPTRERSTTSPRFLTIGNPAPTARASACGRRVWLVALARCGWGHRVATMAGLSQQKRAEVLDRMLNSSSFVPRELALLIKISAAFRADEHALGPGALWLRPPRRRARLQVEPVTTRERATSGRARCRDLRRPCFDPGSCVMKLLIEDEADFVIVGTGAGGATAARVLSGRGLSW